MPSMSRLAALIPLVLLASCSSTVVESGTNPNNPDPQKPGTCQAGATCTPSTGGVEIGTGDGSAASVTFTEIYKIGPAAGLVDLAFDPQTGNLWVIGYNDNSVHVGSGVLGEAPSWKRAVDPAARHFMHKPPAFAMTPNGIWGICGNNDNGQNGPTNYFMGPATFSMDPAIFAKRTAGGLGSHLDMLHSSPFCRGIAHVKDTTFWVFNGHDNALDLYDFRTPHEPGGDDHSDGVIFRYADGQVKPAADETSSHIFFDSEDSFLYVADTGNQRIARLDTRTGKRGGSLPRRNEPLIDEAYMEETTLADVVPKGTLEKPSGLEVKGGLVYVTDAATSKFHVFEKTGKEVRSLATDLPAGSLSGFTFGPDGKIWFTDRLGGRVLRIDTK
ncbi:MAG: hypothetical protein JST00_08465 [Deltaproteobacteria bacterium]|nr:hypothetical protein [Deltaproteobacteria bacterium]